MKTMIKNLALSLLASMTALVLAAHVRAYDATDKYETRTLDGWTVRINQQLLKDHPALASDTLRLLDFQLYQITRVVPPRSLEALQVVPIWIEFAHPLNPCMCYHPSADWLREHDMNPAKARCVEISNVTNFLAWTKEQPWMVLHELAHSFHDRVLGFHNSEVKAAYDRAVASKSYDNVLRINGATGRHYAMTNDQEYFAECSEAFFGTNDFFPFTRAELKQHDPDMYKLLTLLWGVESPTQATRASPVAQ